MIKCLLDKMKWGEWYRQCDVAVLGYYWPSDDTWQRISSASRPRWIVGNWNCEEQNQIRGGTTVLGREMIRVVDV